MDVGSVVQPSEAVSVTEVAAAPSATVLGLSESVTADWVGRAMLACNQGVAKRFGLTRTLWELPGVSPSIVAVAPAIVTLSALQSLSRTYSLYSLSSLCSTI